MMLDDQEFLGTSNIAVGGITIMGVKSKNYYWDY